MKKVWLILLAAVLLCGSCVRRMAEAPSDSVGVGRQPRTEANDGEPAGSSEENPDPVPPETEAQDPEPVSDPPKAETDAPAVPVGQEDPPAPVTDPTPVTDPVTQTETPPETLPAVTNPDSLSPFGAFKWYQLNGRYVYDYPAKNTSGMDTIGEMYTWPVTYWEDKNKDNNDWFPGKVIYDEWTGEITYPWDRFKSTLDTLAEYGAIYRGDTSRKVIYLTFDCGYEYGATESILDTLRSRNAPATFFLTGPYVRGKSDGFTKEYIQSLIRRMLDEGHLVGNHTNTHPVMADTDGGLTVDEVIDEMRQVEASFREAFPDAPEMLYFRPPQGAANEWLLRIEAKLGYRTVFWSFAYNDWSKTEQPDPDYALSVMKAGIHPGCVYLLHAESSTNAQVLGPFIDWARGQGYTVEPICAIGK